MFKTKFLTSFQNARLDFEQEYVRSLLEFTKGNVTHSARIAKKERKDFYSLMERAGVNPTEYRLPRGQDEILS